MVDGFDVAMRRLNIAARWWGNFANSAKNEADAPAKSRKLCDRSKSLAAPELQGSPKMCFLGCVNSEINLSMIRQMLRA